MLRILSGLDDLGKIRKLVVRLMLFEQSNIGGVEAVGSP